MTPLDRRCARLARVYPAGPRRAEVAATLADCNAGRSAPRVADVLDVLWHGFVARLGSTAAGERFGVWGDSAAVAVVQVVVMQAATAAVLAAHAARRPATEYPAYPHYPQQSHSGPVFYTRAEAYAAAAAALVAVVAAVAAARGKVLVARVAALAAAAGVAGAVLASRAGGNDRTFTTRGAISLAVVGLLGTAAVIGTRAVARSARLVPARWWAVVAVVCAALTVPVELTAPRFGSGRADVVVAAYLAQAAALLPLAVPFARRRRAVLGGSLVVAGGGAALASWTVNWSFVSVGEVGEPEVVLAVALVLLPVAAVVAGWLDRQSA